MWVISSRFRSESTKRLQSRLSRVSKSGLQCSKSESRKNLECRWSWVHNGSTLSSWWSATTLLRSTSHGLSCSENINSQPPPDPLNECVCVRVCVFWPSLMSAPFLLMLPPLTSSPFVFFFLKLLWCRAKLSLQPGPVVLVCQLEERGGGGDGVGLWKGGRKVMGEVGDTLVFVRLRKYPALVLTTV